MKLEKLLCSTTRISCAPRWHGLNPLAWRRWSFCRITSCDRSWLDRNEEAATKSYVITVQGYERIDELKSVNTVSSQAFVAMWMDNSLNDAWEHGIEAWYQGRGI